MDGQDLVRVTIEDDGIIDISEVEGFEQEQAPGMIALVAANVEIQEETEPDTLHIVEESDSKETAEHNGETSATLQNGSPQPENTENQEDQSVVPNDNNQPQ